MLKISFLALFLVGILGFPSGLKAQNDGDLLIFNTTGKIELKRGKKPVQDLCGEQVLSGDLLTVTDGSITLINRNQKRVTITQKGSYTYSTLVKMMEKAESSTTVRYFVFVWESMKQEKTQVRTSGGVVRGDEPSRFPYDSATILADTIDFFFRNPSGQPYVFKILTDKFVTLLCDTLTDSVKTIPVAFLQQPACERYCWEISTPFTAPVRQVFFLPDMPSKNKLLEKFLLMQAEGFDLPQPLRNRVALSYMKENHVYLRIP